MKRIVIFGRVTDDLVSDGTKTKPTPFDVYFDPESTTNELKLIIYRYVLFMIVQQFGCVGTNVWLQECITEKNLVQN